MQNAWPKLIGAMVISLLFLGVLVTQKRNMGSMTPQNSNAENAVAPGSTPNMVEHSSHVDAERPGRREVESSQQSNRYKASAQNVDYVFMPAMEALRLPAEKLKRLRLLLIERHESESDAAAIVRKQRRPGGMLVEDAQAAAIKEVDQEIASLVGAELWTTVKGVLEAGIAFSGISTTFAPDLQRAGYALSPEQRLSLGFVLHETSSPRLNPLADQPGPLPVDAQNLTQLDRQVLTRLSGVLTPPQLQYLRDAFAQANGKNAEMRKRRENM